MPCFSSLHPLIYKYGKIEDHFVNTTQNTLIFPTKSIMINICIFEIKTIIKIASATHYKVKESIMDF